MKRPQMQGTRGARAFGRPLTPGAAPAVAGLALGLALGGAACQAPRPALVVTDPDPSVKIPAIVKSVREGHSADAAQMVQDLNSDDPAVRFYSIAGLSRLAGGEDFGYRYYDEDPAARQPAIERWRAWLKDHASTPAATQPR